MNKLEQFREAWTELSIDRKIDIYLDYQRENGDGTEWYGLNKTFFKTFFTDAMEAERAWHFGGDNSWADEYIHFNAYGNLETANDYQIADEADGMVDEIFKCPEVWENYITIDDDEAA